MSLNQSKRNEFLILEAELLDSQAVQCLSNGAYRLLIDFLRRWKRATRTGEITSWDSLPDRLIPFTWTGGSQLIHRKTWGKYRKELIEKGIIQSMGQSGYYQLSGVWRTYRPSPTETGRIEAIDKARHIRKSETQDYREFRRPPSNHVKHKGSNGLPADRPILESELPSPQGVKMAQETGSQSPPVNSTHKINTPPPQERISNGHTIGDVQQSNGSQARCDRDSLLAVQTEAAFKEGVRRNFQNPDDLLKWANDEEDGFTENQTAWAYQIYQEMEERRRCPSMHRKVVLDEWGKNGATVDDAVLLKYLGVQTDKRMERRTEELRKEFGIDAVRDEAKRIRADRDNGQSIKKPLGLLHWRLKDSRGRDNAATS